MTRINSAIPVEHLTDEHLLAEHREIKRLPALFAKTNKATLHKLIHAECVNRSFNVANYSANWFQRIYENQY